MTELLLAATMLCSNYGAYGNTIKEQRDCTIRLFECLSHTASQLLLSSQREETVKCLQKEVIK